MDIAEYFVFDEHGAQIGPSDKQPNKAEYMVGLLNLNNPHLLSRRLAAKRGVINAVKNSPKEKTQALLAKPQKFTSYLRACFSSLI